MIKQQCAAAELHLALETRNIVYKNLQEAKLKKLSSFSVNYAQSDPVFVSLSSQSECIKEYYYKENWTSDIIADLQTSNINGIDFKNIFITF